MAALRFEANADQKPQVHRLAHHAIDFTAHTWRTAISARIDADGKVEVAVARDGLVLARITVHATEDQRLAIMSTPTHIVVNDADRGLTSAD